MMKIGFLACIVSLYSITIDTLQIQATIKPHTINSHQTHPITSHRLHKPIKHSNQHHKPISSINSNPAKQIPITTTHALSSPTHHLHTSESLLHELGKAIDGASNLRLILDQIKARHPNDKSVFEIDHDKLGNPLKQAIQNNNLPLANMLVTDYKIDPNQNHGALMKVVLDHNNPRPQFIGWMKHHGVKITPSKPAWP